MVRKSHLILIAFLCLQLISAANIPQTIQIHLTGVEQGKLLPPAPATDEANQVAGSESSGCTATLIPVQNAAFEQELVERVNAERARAGLSPLKFNEDLAYASRYHANDMLADDYFNHDSYDRVNGSLVMVCGVWDRVKNFYPFDAAAGENIAAGQTTPEQVMAAWMASEGHRANILNPNFRELGVGYYHGDGGYRDYWVQDFGARWDIYPIVIDLENAATSERVVSIYLYGEGVFSEYRIKDDASAWSGWKSFQEQVSWTLNGAGNQAHTITVELRKSNGEVISSSDSIYLDGEATLGNLPERVRFIYNKANQAILPADQDIHPLNTGTDETLTWALSPSTSWIDVSATSGTTPDTVVRVTPVDPNGLADGPYQGNLTFTVTSPSSIAGSTYSVPVELVVVENLANQVFIPSILR